MLRWVLFIVALASVAPIAGCSKKQAAQNTFTEKTPPAPGPVPIPYPIVAEAPSAGQSPARPKPVK
jgi:hypothetical protein